MASCVVWLHSWRARCLTISGILLCGETRLGGRTSWGWARPSFGAGANRIASQDRPYRRECLGTIDGSAAVGRSYMNEHCTNHGSFLGLPGGERVSHLITLATPHDGTPTANDVPSTNGQTAAADWLDLMRDVDQIYWGCAQIQALGQQCDGFTQYLLLGAFASNAS